MKKFIGLLLSLGACSTNPFSEEFSLNIEGSYRIGNKPEDPTFEIKNYKNFVFKQIKYTLIEEISATNAIYLLDDIQYAAVFVNLDKNSLREFYSTNDTDEGIIRDAAENQTSFMGIDI